MTKEQRRVLTILNDELYRSYEEYLPDGCILPDRSPTNGTIKRWSDMVHELLAKDVPEEE